MKKIDLEIEIRMKMIRRNQISRRDTLTIFDIDSDDENETTSVMKIRISEYSSDLEEV